MKPGRSVVVTFEDGTQVAGQVWSLSEAENYVWLALDDGRFVALNLTTRKVHERPNAHSERLGRVAA